jgi:hypothetical protein
MQGAGPVCAFPGSVFGARCPAPGANPVPDIGYLPWHVGSRADSYALLSACMGIGLGLPGGLSCILHLVSYIHSSTEHYGKSVASVALRAYRTP